MSTASSLSRPEVAGQVELALPEVVPNLDEYQIDDGAPVDGIYSEKQMRLLDDALRTPE
ncbi:MAG: hypothetical protein NZO58_13205 [Gemmataceae bacterium]|nr:hypothetical protein [Gemmataceae bacterium]